jgi:uncharacterized protein YxjI
MIDSIPLQKNMRRLYSRLAGNFTGGRRPTVPLYSKPTSSPQHLEPLTNLNSIQGIRPANIKHSPNDKLSSNSSSNTILANPALLIARELEILNVFLGYEQANKYTIRNDQNIPIGYIAEESDSFKGNILRQLLRTRRAFTADILNTFGEIVLKINRPIRLFLNSTIKITDANDNIIGVCKSDWHPWRRRYDLFLNNKQFARIDGGFLSWDFHSKDSNDKDLCIINRNFSGFAVEIFTDKGMYAVHYDTDSVGSRGLSLDQRAVLLATAVTIDIDYFSRSSGNGFMPMPFMPMVGGESGPASDVTGTGTDAAGVVGGVIGSQTDDKEAGGFFGGLFEGGSDLPATPSQSSNWGASEFVEEDDHKDSDGDSWWSGFTDDD